MPTGAAPGPTGRRPAPTAATQPDFSSHGRRSMTPGVHLLVVRPHPEDESSATGGLLARYAARGVRTAVVTCTRGEEGEIHDPDLDPLEAQPRLGDIREAELRAACQV